MRILVTGGAGYIGSHMVRMLGRAGHVATVFDNLSRGHSDAVMTEDFVTGDLMRPDELRRLFQTRSFDLVIHLAAFCYVGESVQNPLQYYENNVAGTLNLLHSMLDAGVDSLVFSSTCATYGIPQAIPITEEHPQQPVNPYGWSKLMVERFLADYSAVYGLKSISLRYFNVAGCDTEGKLGERHDPETHLIPLVLREALRVRQGGDPRNTDLSVFGNDYDTPDGTCIRDFIHVQDLCAAHMAALERLISGDVAGAESYNLGNGLGFSVKEIIEACRHVTGVDIRYRAAARRSGDVPRLVGSSEKARTILGWWPEIAELEAIIETAWRVQSLYSSS